MTDELAQIIHENFNACRGRGGVSPKALAEVIKGSDWLRKVKADLLKEIIHEVRDIPCWYPDGDPMGGEFDLDGESHRRVVLDTLLAYGSKLS